ncbi:hypothetical protein BKA70DRAFT_1381667 [Coprinopsis sp. MPI-PUGE-AT-0042]|nr:hypothetical protein BKA70DRAFT_1381667 [Coprinopsis sp. MPI-PUGE-AT-0042]
MTVPMQLRPSVCCNAPSPIRRLKSPIPLIESPNIQPCTPTRRRSTKTGTHALRRRRGIVQRQTPHPFDQLPWISAMETTPELTNPWDIADLSLLPESGLGPVRRRKTSLRSNPMDAPESPLPVQLPLQLNDDDLPSRPATPKPSQPSLLPSAILFRNLMPVSPSSPSCISIQNLDI